MANVYVSHARTDAGAARAISAALVEAGLTVYDHRQLPAGADWAASLRGELQDAGCVVALWSQAAASSEWVKEEIGTAIRAWSHDRLVLAVLDGTELPTALRDLERIDLAADMGRGTAQVVARVLTQARAPIPPPPPPSPESREAPSPVGEQTGAHSLPRPAAGTRRAGMWAAVTLAAAIPVAIGVMVVLLPRGSPAPPPDVPPATAFPLLPLLGVSLAVVLGLGTALWSLRRWRRRPREDEAPRGHATAPLPGPARAPHALFVSYSRKDQDTVDPIVRGIEQAGVPVWIDRAASSGGGRFAGPIVQAIRSSRVVALMSSRHAFDSSQVVRELYVAGDLKKPFIVFQLDASEIPDEFLYFVSGYPRVPAANITPDRLRSEISPWKV